jgi:hypothetical protein
MKKIILFGLSLILALGLASVTMASTVYIDFTTDGEVDLDSFTEDFSQIAVGFEMPTDEYKVTCNVTSGTIKNYFSGYDYTDIDTIGVLLKGGYALINNRQTRFDITGGFYGREIKWDYYYYHDTDWKKELLYSFIIGFDARLKLNRKAWVDFSYSLGLAPQGEITTFYDSYKYDIDSISLLNCKFNLRLTEEFGASLGYQSETIDLEKNDKMKFAGLTLGVFFKF